MTAQNEDFSVLEALYGERSVEDLTEDQKSILAEQKLFLSNIELPMVEPSQTVIQSIRDKAIAPKWTDVITKILFHPAVATGCALVLIVGIASALWLQSPMESEQLSQKSAMKLDIAQVDELDSDQALQSTLAKQTTAKPMTVAPEGIQKQKTREIPALQKSKVMPKDNILGNVSSESKKRRKLEEVPVRDRRYKSKAKRRVSGNVPSRSIVVKKDSVQRPNTPGLASKNLASGAVTSTGSNSRSNITTRRTQALRSRRDESNADTSGKAGKSAQQEVTSERPAPSLSAAEDSTSAKNGDDRIQDKDGSSDVESESFLDADAEPGKTNKAQSARTQVIRLHAAARIAAGKKDCKQVGALAKKIEKLDKHYYKKVFTIDKAILCKQ